MEEDKDGWDAGGGRGEKGNDKKNDKRRKGKGKEELTDFGSASYTELNLR